LRHIYVPNLRRQQYIVKRSHLLRHIRIYAPNLRRHHYFLVLMYTNWMLNILQTAFYTSITYKKCFQHLRINLNRISKWTISGNTHCAKYILIISVIITRNTVSYFCHQLQICYDICFESERNTNVIIVHNVSWFEKGGNIHVLYPTVEELNYQNIKNLIKVQP
jgi:hypothetical protein